eukprot:gene33058-39990_t
MISLASVSDTLKLWTSEGNAAADLVVNNCYRSATNSNFHSVAWNHTNQVVAIGGSEPKVHLVQVQNGQLLSSLVLSESKLSHFHVQAVVFSHNSRYLACSMGSPIQVWDLKRRQIKSVFTGHAHSIVSLAFLASGDVFAADAKGQIKLWSLKSTAPIHEIQDKDDASRHLTCMAVSTVSSVLAAGYMDGSLRIWDAVSNHDVPNTLLRTQVCHKGKVSGIACSPKNSRLVSTVGTDGKLVLIDTGSRSATDVCAVCETGEVLTSLAFHENGIHSAVGTMEGNILLYDWRNLRHPVINLPAHSPNPVNALAYQFPTKSSSGRAPETPSMNSVATERTDGTDRLAAATSALRKTEAHDSSAHDLSLELPPPAPTLKPSVLGPEIKPLPKPREENLANSAVNPPQSAAPRPSELLDNSFVSSFNHRLQTHIAVGGHDTSNNQSFISTASGRPANVEEARTEAVPDLAHAHSKLYAEVDKALNRSFMSTTSKLPGDADVAFEDLRQAVRPVSAKDLEEALEVLRYDIHNEVQEIIKEQVRQFVIAKDETAQLIQGLSAQLADLVQANKELREENDRLRRIY